MAKADLHVHSKYSDYPGTWILKAYDSPESFTEPETLYQQAKFRGMDFVTITDHDDIRGCLELIAAHPDDCFISCEVTTYFPSDDCKIHILVYGISQQQYDHISAIRRNIFNLRAYIAEQGIAYSVAHATYDQDGKLDFSHIEQLVLMFDVFEVINGGSDAQNNIMLHNYLQNLDEAALQALQRKHNIQPLSDTPWIKGYTGGSDDHCGILIGSAYTQSDSQTLDQFLAKLGNKSCLANGMHGSFETYATGIFKHVHDYRSARDPKYKNTKMNDFLEMFFVGEKGNWAKRFKKSQSLRYLKHKNSKTHRALHKLLSQVSEESEQDIALKIPSTYENIALLHDEMFDSVINAITKHIPKGDIFKGFNRLATLFPMTLLATPFIGSMRHQVLKSNIKRKLIEGTNQNYTEKALWVTDTIDDLNGVSVTLRQIAIHSLKQGYQLKLVTCIDEKRISRPLPKNTLNFTPIKEFKAPGYETQTIGFPSLLSMMKKITLEQPDQIIISTPGPLGLGALLCARLMDLPVKMIYHTDFAEQLMRISGEKALANLSDQLVNTFYKMADTVFVPSKSYIDKLTRAGLEPNKLNIFPRALDLELYCPSNETTVLNHSKLAGSFTLLFAGRISEDKNLSLLVKIYNELERRKPGLYNLVIAGDGPDLVNLKNQLGVHNNVLFTDRISAEELVDWYCASDLLVFPSHTDTFGMVVLEAQACGLPCLVSSSGGPKEIIDPGATGNIVHTDLLEDWSALITVYRKMKLSQPDKFSDLRERCVKHVHQENSWQPVFETVLGESCKLPSVNIELIQPEPTPNSPTRDIAA